MRISDIPTASKAQLEQLLDDLDFAEIEMTGGFTEQAIAGLREAAESRLAELEKNK